MHIFLLETFYFIRKFFYLEQIVLFSLLFLKFMASHILDSNPAKLPLWNCKSQDSRTGYMSFWLCISWQFSYGILGLKRSDRSCRFANITMTMTGKTRYIAPPLDFRLSQTATINLKLIRKRKYVAYPMVFGYACDFHVDPSYNAQWSNKWKAHIANRKCWVGAVRGRWTQPKGRSEL